MTFVALIFALISLFAGGAALWAGEYIDGVAIVIGSYMAFAAGSGFRGSLHLRSPLLLPALIGGAIFACSLAIMHYLELAVGPVDGRVWAAIVATVGLLATTNEDVIPRGRIASTLGKVRSEGLLDDCFAVVGAYGNIMEEHPGTVFPIGKLPLPKQQMKKALKIVWVAADEQSSKDAIEAGYSHLAYFREDVDRPTLQGLEELKSILEAETLNIELTEEVSKKVSFFGTVNADALELALEFEEFKAKRAV